MSEIHHGGCLCGAVRYQTTGQPVTAYVCHCSYCKRSSGSAFQVAVFFKKAKVEFSGITPSVFDYVSPVHGRTIQTLFCPHCGTKLASNISRVPQVHLIAGGTFDEPTWFKITAQLFTDQALSWVGFSQDAPCYAQHFITEQGEAVAPRAMPAAE